MNQGDLNKVWEIKALKRKPGEDEAKKMLQQIANQVQPIMRKHKWRVKLLSELCPKNARLLGLNVNHGVHVKLRLRRPNRDNDFYPYDQVLDTMLHELCHNAIGPHNARFYRLWDELRKECEELISKGISGMGQGFDLPGRRLGGFSRQPPMSQLRQAAASAAEKRAVLGSILPSGPNRLGGDSSIMAAFTPVQAAAMAAERRMQDDVWCASGLCEDSEDNENPTLQGVGDVTEKPNPKDSVSSKQISDSVSRKRSRQVDALQSSKKSQKNITVSGVASTSQKRSFGSDNVLLPKSKYDGTSTSHGVISSSTSSTMRRPDDAATSVEELLMWDCEICTLLNPPLAPVCKVCRVQRRKDGDTNSKLWSCKFCTVENSVSLRDVQYVSSGGIHSGLQYPHMHLIAEIKGCESETHFARKNKEEGSGLAGQPKR